MRLADILKPSSGVKKVSAPRANKTLSTDTLRRIYLDFYKLFWANPVNQFHACSTYYATNMVCKWNAKLRVQRRGLNDPEFAVTAEESTWNSMGMSTESRRVLVRCKGPLRSTDIDAIVKVLVGTLQRGAHHRMDVLMVGGGQVMGEFGYDRRMFSGDRTGPTAYLARALLKWLRRQDVPVEADAYVQDAVRGRRAGFGDDLPASCVFRS